MLGIVGNSSSESFPTASNASLSVLVACWNANLREFGEKLLEMGFVAHSKKASETPSDRLHVRFNSAGVSSLGTFSQALLCHELA